MDGWMDGWMDTSLRVGRFSCVRSSNKPQTMPVDPGQVRMSGQGVRSGQGIMSARWGGVGVGVGAAVPSSAARSMLCGKAITPVSAAAAPRCGRSSDMAMPFSLATKGSPRTIILPATLETGRSG